MKKVPISLIIDDSSPVVSVYYHHHNPKTTKDGRPLLEHFPNSFLDTFCDIVQKYGVKGKFSVVPMPGNQGDIINGLKGVDQTLVTQWLDTVKTRLVPNFTIGPEILSHNKAVDLTTGEALEMREDVWASSQDRTTLTPYIARALQLVNDAGFDAFGVTSPWALGIDVEAEYTAAISKAVYDVTGKKNAWFFLRGLRGLPDAKPWVQLEEDGRTLVAIPATTHDAIWDSIDCPNPDDAFIQRQADYLITADGKAGQIIRVLETNGWPVLVTHWQALVSNGLGTGLRIMEEICRRVETHLKDQVEWKSFAEILEMVIADKESFPFPKKFNP